MATYGFCENKCKHEIYTKEEIDTKIEGIELDSYSKSETYTKTETGAAIDNSIAALNLGTISTHNYSRGIEAPTGGADGDIYDQYFE